MHTKQLAWLAATQVASDRMMLTCFGTTVVTNEYEVIVVVVASS